MSISYSLNSTSQQSPAQNESSEQADSYSASKLSSIPESEDRISIPDPTLLQTQPRSITQPLLQLVVSVKIVVLALVAILQLLLELLLLVIRHFTPRTKYYKAKA